MLRGGNDRGDSAHGGRGGSVQWGMTEEAVLRWSCLRGSALGATAEGLNTGFPD